MKKLIVALVLCALVVPQAYAEDSKEDLLNTIDPLLMEIWKNLRSTWVKLTETEISLTEVGQGSDDIREMFDVVVIGKDIVAAKRTIQDVMHIISLLPLIKDEVKPNLFKTWGDTLNTLKKQIEFSLDSIKQQQYPGVKDTAALHLIDKAKEDIKASMQLVDEVTAILETVVGIAEKGNKQEG